MKTSAFGLNCVSPAKKEISTQNMRIFKKKVFADVMKYLGMRSSWVIRWAVNPPTSALISTEDTDRIEKARRWGGVGGEGLWSQRQRVEWGSHSQGTCGAPRSPKRQEGFSPRAKEGAGPCQQPDFTLWLLGWRMNCYCFKPPTCNLYSSPERLIHLP